MTTALALTVLALVPLAQDPEPPTPEAVERAVATMKEAFGPGGDSAARIEALAETASVLDPEVIALHARAVGDRDDEVCRAALGTLGTMSHPDALTALHSLYRRDRRIRKEPESLAVMLRSIGMHGNPASIGLLGDGALSEIDYQVSRARVYGLGNIRDARSVERLIGMMKKAGRRRTQPHMENLRVALMVLTGVDQGTSQDAWLAWWNDHKKTLEVSPTPPALPRSVQVRWNEYWGLRGPVERRTRRTDRGG